VQTLEFDLFLKNYPRPSGKGDLLFAITFELPRGLLGLAKLVIFIYTLLLTIAFVLLRIVYIRFPTPFTMPSSHSCLIVTVSKRVLFDWIEELCPSGLCSPPCKLTFKVPSVFCAMTCATFDINHCRHSILSHNTIGTVYLTLLVISALSVCLSDWLAGTSIFFTRTHNIRV